MSADDMDYAQLEAMLSGEVRKEHTRMATQRVLFNNA